jgi:hypothetical protein
MIAARFIHREGTNMKNTALAATMILACATAWASEEDWAAARKASCQELVDAYKSTAMAEKKVAAAIKDSKDGTVAANVLGVATLAAFGVGFFHWNDHSSAEENLADLRHDLMIIKSVSAEKKCNLPAV